ncbi:MAG: type II toxin-antitoxin system VapC family toxin [Desulfobacterales bacterium]|nr:type II toxin-antitoxin system VapC family toxin [Desulfobacteraceae bacterium]MBT7086957.1 type II toxin-antitoxin system VapC family toxin [Desulfobacterales bacterium]
MVLVDTSVWVNHLRNGNKNLEDLLSKGKVMCHTHIIGELACGNIKNRKQILSLLRDLPLSPLVEFNEYLYFIDEHKLHGAGIGFVDIHLLASAKLAQVKLWTNDKKLSSAATNLGINPRNF